jgi:hypothetical protein
MLGLLKIDFEAESKFARLWMRIPTTGVVGLLLEILRVSVVSFGF